MKTYFSVNIGSKVFALVALLLFITASNSLAGTKTAMGSGNWNSITWSPSGSPTSNDDVIIKQGYNVTVNGTYACKSIQLGSSASTAGNGTLTFNAGSQLTVSGIVTLGMSPSYTGTINMTSGGTLICNSFAVAGAGTNTFTKGTGTVQLTANNTLPTSAFTAFNNLVISNGAITTVGGTYTCNSLQLGSSTVPAGNGTLSFNAGSQITVAGAVTLGMSTYGGTLSMASGGTLISNSLAVAGTGTNTFTPGSGTIQLAANNTLPTSVFTAFNNLVINNASTTTIGGTYTCKSLQLGSSAAPAGNGTLLFNAGSQITVAGAVTLGMGTYGGTLTMTSGGTLACNSLAVAGSGTNTFTKGTGTVQLTANNTLPTSVFNAFNNLVISNGATTTMNSTYTANSIQLGSTNAPAGNGTLAFASGSQLTIAGTLTSGMGTYAGVVDMTSGGTLISNAFAASGSGASSFIGGTGTVRLPANNTLPATGFSSFNNLVICGGSTTTLTGSYSCNSLQLGSSVAPTGNGTLLFNAGSQITVNGVVTLGASTYKGVIDMTSGGTLTCNSIVLAGSGANSFIPGAGTLQMAGNNTLPSTVFTTFNNLSCSGGTTIANSGFTAASISLTGTANLTLSGAYDYTVTGNLTSTAGTTLTQNTDWSTGTRRLNIGGNFLLSGAYTYSGVSPLVRLYGTGSKSFKGLGLCFVLLESGDYTCAGNVSFTNQFWAMYNTTGTLHTGANSITGTTMTGNLFICKGTVTVDNGGSINAFTIFNGTIPSQSYGGNGTLIINSGGSVTSTLFYNGSYNGIASNVTINGTLNVINQTVGGTPQTGQIINGKWGSSTPCVININDGGLLNSTNEIINGFNSSPGTINVSNLGTITAGGMCNGKYPNGSGSSAGILNCTGNATINIHDTPTQWYCWSDFGTFNCGTSTVTFNGTGNGYILENTGSKFYNLVINKPSGNNMLALTPVHVLVDFTLSSGDFGYSGVQSMNVGRNWTQTGTSNYNHSNTPVTFDGTNSTITTTSTGTIAFYDVIIADVAIQASNVDINGSLTINNGKSHSTSASNYALSIGGSLTNNGTFTSGNSTVTFDDVIDGNITGSNACSFYNMVINKSASTNTLTNGATSKVFTIGNDLTITQGKLILCAVDGDYNIARNVYVASNGTLTHSVAWDTYSKKINVTGSFEVDGLLNPT
ncbi:MAG: hypothetical protein WCL06_10080, partial [Bacteroidota bacterium]